ncbi:MAG: Hpt domain-containing protein [Verrucomicrobiaceae bacterium]|nr:MAG: Hpt domain-containing protein [Verrucomicrobiaceae bacterium]
MQWRHLKAPGEPEKMALTTSGKSSCVWWMGEASKLIDWEQLDMMAFGYAPEFVAIYLEFLQHAPGQFASLDEAIRDGDADKVAKLAHMIRGSTLNFGFQGVSSLMEELETDAKDRRTLDRAAELIRKARENFELARAEVSEARNI